MGKKLFVGNLSYNSSGDDLRDLFAQHGQCESATVVTDRTSGRSRGFGFVEMSSPEEAEQAAGQLNGTEFQGRKIVVSPAHERDGERRGGGGGGGGSRRDSGGGGGGGGRSGGSLGFGRRRF